MNLEKVPSQFRSSISPNGKEISLPNCGLTLLPEWVRAFSAITSLNLSGNKIITLPDWLGQLNNLVYLSLDANQLTEIPESLRNLATLRQVYLDGNQLTEVPDVLRDLSSLTELYLSNNQLSSVPAWLGNLTSLTRLHLNRNRLFDLPGSLGNLTALTTLFLRDNQLTEIPESLGNLAVLTNLNLGANKLAALPESLGNLSALTKLNLNGNRLAALPESLGNLTALIELRVSGDQPDPLDILKNRPVQTVPELTGNRLTELPESLGNLTALTNLDLSGNKLTALPDSLGKLANLSTLNLNGNPLRSPLLEISENGTAAIKAYFAHLLDGAAELWTSKLLVVGEGATGKTSLVKALNSQKHDPFEPSTHGIRIVEVKLPHPTRPNIVMHLSSWDFGGQDIYHATHQFFLSDRSLFVLLWNARQGWEHAKLPYWLDIIKVRAPQARVVLVATHAEGRPIDLPLTDLKASYPQIVGTTSVDNSTGEGLQELRRKLADEAAKLPLMGSRWPATWVSGVDAISKCGLQHATPEDLHRRLSAAGVTDPSHQSYLLRALHLLGEILYFDDDEELRDTVILRPQWVNVYIAKVLDSPEVAKKHGLLTRSHERQLWLDLNPGLRDRFLRMMEKFDLSYRITDHATAASLVVERLPWDSPSYRQRWDAALYEQGTREIHLRYQLNTLPPGVPTWFIAREHRFTTETHWRSGALLQYTGDTRVLGLIRAERKDKTVDLAVRGPVPQLFFSVLQDGFESTLSRYQGLEITQMVPCTCMCGNGTERGRPCAHLYQYYPLLRRLERGVSEVECELSFSKVSVAELLFGISPATTDQLMTRLDSIDERLDDFRAESAWANREFLKSLRQIQARAESLCPSVFTLTPVIGGTPRPGFQRLELRLYCEQPGAFHATKEPPYRINQPTRWLIGIRPYLAVLLTMLKHTAPLAAPVLGLASDYLANQLANEVSLMTELVNQLPDTMSAGRVRTDDLRPPRLDADFRALSAVLHELDPGDQWGGLNRTYTPEGELLWLCGDHARQYISGRPGTI